MIEPVMPEGAASPKEAGPSAAGPGPAGPAGQVGPNISPASPDRKGDEVDAGVARRRVSWLVGRAREGDRDAFGELYRMYHGPVHRLARFHAPGSAEDVVAETFLRAWSALPRYRDTGPPFVAWLYGIARHVVADEIRSLRRTEPRAVVGDDTITAGNPHDDRIALAAAMGRLPREQRIVIELKFLAGLTNEEVARGLGKSIGAVNAQQWRALAALRRLMES